MKKTTFIFIIFLFNIMIMKGQEVRGRVMNEQNVPIAYASVMLRNVAHSTIVHGGISDESGNFQVKLPVGSYQMSCRFIGYIQVEREVVVKQDIAVGDIIMKEDVYQLKGVDVVASRIKRKLGGFEINMMNSPLSKGKNIQQVLSFLPGVSTDSGISINGRGGTLVYIDDRKVKNIAELDILRAEDIKTVEVIPIAGSEYGAGVEGGVLKITLRKQEGGLTGSLVNYLKMRDNGFKSEAPAIIANYRYKKFGINNMTVVGVGRYYPNDEERQTYYADGGSLIEDSKVKRNSLQFNENLTFRYDISKRQNIALNLEMNLVRDSLHRRSTGTFVSDDTSTSNKMTGKGKARINNFSSSLMYQLRIGKSGHRFTLEMDYQNILEKSLNVYDYLNWDMEEKTEAYIQTDDNKSRTQAISVRPKMNFKLAKRTNLILGLSSDYMHNQNDINNSDHVEDYTLRGTDNAFFADFKTFFSNKAYLGAGIRYQTDKVKHKRTNMPEADFSKTFNGLFPTLKFEYLLNQTRGRGLSLGYRHYQSLPAIGYYSAIKEIYSDNYYSVGNPNIEPERFHLAEMTYIHNKVFNLVYSFKYGKDLIQVMTFTDKKTPLLSYTQPVNIGMSRLHRLAAEVRWSPFSWWFCKIDLSGNYENRSYGGNRFNQWFGQASINNNFKTRNNWSATIYVSNSTKRRLGDYTFSSGYSADITINKSLFEERLNIGIGSSNIIYKRRDVITELENGNFINSLGREPLRDYYINISYNFRYGKKIKNVQGLRGVKLDVTKATR